MREDGLSS